MNKKRPINLDLTTIKLPVMAIASILHRISGMVLFLLLPLMLFFLHQSLTSADSFANLQLTLQHPFLKLVIWGFCAALAYHVLAGIRHMIMDAGFGEQVSTGKHSALAVIVCSVILTVFVGIWIW